MEKCKVEFVSESNQKIIIDFTLNDNGDLDYKPTFQPAIKDPKTKLGLTGKLCEIFISSLMQYKKTENSEDKTNE